MNLVKFNEKKQNNLKILSNIICLIGKIGAIVLKIAIPFIIIAMILIPFIVNNIEINNNKIGFKTNNIKIVDENKIAINDIIIGEFDVEDDNNDIISLFQNNSNTKIIGYLELELIFLLLDIIVMIIMLSNVEKLFNNIKINSTPFTLDNVTFIKNISYLITALIIITSLSEFIFNILFRLSEYNSPFEIMNILEILIIFSMSYMFEYGYEIQKDSKARIYN